MDKDGDYIGPMLSWSVITEKVKLDADAARLTQMVDNMPINVMMCDPKTLEINYINQTSIDTLKTLEHLLPVKADALLGQCIDIFHKNPTHQRKLLADPKNLPHQARIQIGDETLDLKVSAIMDKDGGYIGPMLSWSVITNIVTMTNNFERHVKGVVQTVASASTELQASAEEMSSIAKRTSEQSASVSAAAEEATTNVQTVAAAAEELSSSISEISRQVSKSSEVAQNAVTQAEETNVTVEGLAEAAQKIGDVVSLINDIAGQTNLLALNATIEAARAGDAGRGFAVVASEVKNLANQTAKATEEIGNQISAIQGATGEAVSAIKGIGSTIKEINEIAASIASAVEEQGAATSEISRNVQEAATGTQEVTGTISQVAAAADEAGQSAGQVLEAASELSQQSETLGKEIAAFINKE
ncbi:MAG: chemotaxis protein [Rhodospirillaceae bacterium]|nr:MAG: chemotaxis protein [Rhodospirillaceae bacterium]